MSISRSQGLLRVMLAGGLLCAASVSPISHAEVTASGLGTVVNQPSAGVFDITGGTRPDNGANLFHSFGDFSLDVPESANFLSDGFATTNILSRVTGGNPSNIFGTIDTSAFPGANLFLMNPAGIVFGPTAQLNVDGSFHATTADYITLGNEGGIFYANPGQQTVLSVAAPSAFGFLNSNPAPIDVQTGAVDFDTFEILNLLQVPEGETLSLVGGNINIGTADFSSSGFLFAPGGTVNLVSVASPGEATINSPINTDAFTELGNINISGGSLIDGKNVYIRSGQLTINDAIVWPGVFSLFDLGPPPDGGEVNVNVRNDFTITGTDTDPFIGLAWPGIFTFAGDLFDIPTVATKVPDITIQTNTLSLSGVASVQNLRAGPGIPGDVIVNADRVRAEDGAYIGALNFYEGFGGNVLINANQVDLVGESSGIFVQGLLNFFALCFCDPGLTLADSGAITLNVADTLTLSGGAQISTLSGSFGRGGDITINAGNIVAADRGSLIDSESFYAGGSGNVTINVSGQIEIRDGAVFGNNTLGTGQAGVLDVSAGQSIDISGTASGMAAQTFPPGDFELFILAAQLGFPDYPTMLEELGLPPDTDFFGVMAFFNASGLTELQEPLVPGNGGSLVVTAPVITVDGQQSAIDSGTAWDGNAGAVQLNADSLSVSGGAEIRSRTGIFLIETGELIVGTGNAGSVTVDATNTISVSGADSTGVPSAISTSALGDGDGGDISLNAANEVQISNGGSVTADSFGAGLTGSINITAGNSIVLNNGTISTLAETSDGGNIKLTAPNIVQLTSSQITTSVESGEGGGGNINIDPQFIVLNNSQITANAFGGPGGNISLTANNFVPSADSVVSASSALSTQGTIVIESPENDIAGSISQLPQSIVDVSGLLPERCAARGAGGVQSSFVVAGRGGLPTNPDNYLPSFSAGSGPVKRGGMTKPAASLSEVGYTNQTTIAMAGWGCPR